MFVPLLEKGELYESSLAAAKDLLEPAFQYSSHFLNFYRADITSPAPSVCEPQFA